jgi:putative ABC transport system permease protein
MLSRGIRDTMLAAGSPLRVIVLDVNARTEGGSRVRQTALGLVQAAVVPATTGAAPEGSAARNPGRAYAVGETVVHVFLSKSKNRDEQASIQVRGVSPGSFQLRPQVELVAGRLAAPGSDEAIVGKSLLTGNYQGLALGQGFDLKKNRPIKIVGVFAAGGSALESEVWADLETVRQCFALEGTYSSITAELPSVEHYEFVHNALSADKRLGLSVLTETAYYERASNNLAAGMAGFGSVVSAIAALAATLGAMITLYASVSQRKREIGVLRALGFSRNDVLVGLLLESTAVAFLGGVLGVMLALLASFGEFSSVNWATEQQIVFHFKVTLDTLALALGAGIGVGLLGGLHPALQAAKVDPAQAVRL